MDGGLFLPRARSDSNVARAWNANDEINQGNIGCWPLDEAGGSMARDVSPWRAHGTLTSGPTRIVGLEGRATNFNGTSSYIATATRAQTITAFSGVAWVFTTGGFNRCILSTIASGGSEILWQVDNSGQRIDFWANTSFAQASASGLPSFANRWALIGVTWAPGRATRLYLDGVDVGGGSTGGDVPPNIPSINIGRWSNNTRFFDGGMRLVRVWRRVLSAREMRRLYDEPWAGTQEESARVFVPFGLGGGVVNLTGNAVGAGTPGVTSPALGQIHALTGTAVGTATPGVTSPALGQVHALQGLSVGTPAPGVTSPALGQVHALAGVAVGAATPGTTTPTLRQVHALLGVAVGAGRPGVSSPVLGEPSSVVLAATPERTLTWRHAARAARWVADARRVTWPDPDRTVTWRQ